eukprot:scaffold3903_cov156-Skeletonema_dohrnii-CCMP3373.AAC.2
MEEELEWVIGVVLPKHHELNIDQLSTPNPYNVLAESAKSINSRVQAIPPDPPDPHPTIKHVHWKDQMRSRRKQRKDAARLVKLERKALNDELTVLSNRNNLHRTLAQDVLDYRVTKYQNKQILKGILKVTPRRGKRDKISLRHVNCPTTATTSPPKGIFHSLTSLRHKFNDMANSASVALCKTKEIIGIKSGIIDSGATNHFGTEDGGFVSTGVPSKKIIGTASGQPMTATVEAVLPMTQLRPEARQADIVPQLKNSLVSISRLADSNYVTIFRPGGKGVEVYDENDVKVTITGEAVLKGWRDGNLWRVPLEDGGSLPISDSTMAEAANNLFELPSIGEGIRYLHASLGFPVKSTWLKAIRAGNFAGWPLVTVENVNKYFPESDETQYGHLNQQRQGVRSTKPREAFVEIDASAAAGKKEKDVYIKVFDMKHQVFSDQTGAFPVRSRGGHRYLMVMLEIDSNVILVEAMKSKKDAEMQRAYLALIGRLKRAGVQIKKHLLPQTELTLNLLRQSNAYPTVSAHQALFGTFDYNRQPLAPLGCEVLIHEAAGNRPSWGQHAKKGWSLGTSSEHYRSHIIFVKETNSERIGETVFFKHHYITKPKVTHADLVITAAQKLAKTIQRKANWTGDKNLRGLQALSEMFSSIARNESPSSWEKEYVPAEEPSSPPPRVDTTSHSPPRVETTSHSPPRVESSQQSRTNTSSLDGTSSRCDVDSTSPTSQVHVPTKPVSPLQKLLSDFQAASSPATTTLYTPNRLIREMRAPEISQSNILPSRTRSGASAPTANSEYLANALFALDSMEEEYLKPHNPIQASHAALTDLAYNILAEELPSFAYNVVDPNTGKLL